MLPVSTTSAFTTPPPIVNTTIPGTNETRVPPTAVAPSFSSPQVDNNARGNTTIFRQQAEEAPPPPSGVASSASPNVGVPQSASDKFTLGAQTNFLAQLIGQDLTPSAQGVLVQYEKLVNIGNVKYKPSDALKPQEQPSSLFGKLLQAEHSEPTAPKISVAELAAASATHAQLPLAPTQASSSIVEGQRPARPSFTEEIAQEDATTASHAAQSYAAPRAITAYANTASRIASQTRTDTSFDEPVSEIA